MNFTASFLSRFGREIRDSLGNTIQTISYSPQILNYRYHRPSIIFSILEGTKKMKEPVIKEIKNLADVDKLGYILVSVPISYGTGWVRGQKTIMKLFKKGTVGLLPSSKINVMPRAVGQVHSVQVDEANLLIRLIGPKASPTGIGPWLPLGDE